MERPKEEKRRKEKLSHFILGNVIYVHQAQSGCPPTRYQGEEKSLEEQRQKKLNWMGDVSFFDLCFLELSLYTLEQQRNKVGKNINIGSRSCSLRNSRVKWSREEQGDAWCAMWCGLHISCLSLHWTLKFLIQHFLLFRGFTRFGMNLREWCFPRGAIMRHCVHVFPYLLGSILYGAVHSFSSSSSSSSSYFTRAHALAIYCCQAGDILP